MILPTVKTTRQLRSHLRKRRIPFVAVKKLAQRSLSECDSISLALLSAEGFSGTALIVARGRDRAAQVPIQPQVLKVGRKKPIRDEYRRFNRYVLQLLKSVPGQTRTLQTYRDWAALPYWRIGASSTVRSLGTFYAHARTEEIVAICAKLFDGVMSPWLRAFTSHYRHIFKGCYGISSAGLTKITSEAERLIKVGRSGDPVAKWRSLTKLDHSPTVVYESIIHGDLNCNNVLIDDGGNPWLIDFAHTGPGHYLRDLAKLEAEVKFLLMDPDGDRTRIPRWLELDRVLDDRWPFGYRPAPAVYSACRDQHLSKAFAVLTSIRTVARDRMIGPKPPQIAQYRAALLHHTLRVIAYDDVSPAKKKYALLSAARLAEFKYEVEGESPLSECSSHAGSHATRTQPIMAFVFAHGGFSFSPEHTSEVSERYLGVCACLFATPEYNRMCQKLRRGPVGEFSPETIKGPITESSFFVVGAVVDKLQLYIENSKTNFYLAALSAIATPICEYVTSAKSLGVLYMGSHEKSRHQAAFETICRDGDRARKGDFFQRNLLRLHFRSTDRWPGLRLAETIAPCVTAAILADTVAEGDYSGWIPSPSHQLADLVKTKWLCNDIMGDRYGRVLVE